MPEGDTLAIAAARVGAAIAGATLIEVTGTARDVRREGRRMRGKRVESVTSTGKHLLVEFDNGWALRTHLGMTGSWHLYDPGERWRTTPGKARVVLSTAEKVAVCFAAPSVQLGPSDRVHAAIAHLGPDVMDDAVDIEAIVDLASDAPGPTAADLLLDQRVMAGVGNVYKSEILFLERVHPETPIGSLDEDTVRRLATTASKLLKANRTTNARSTTGNRRDGGRTWVYGRARRGCRRCPDSIVADRQGDLDRITYWCPTCQRRRPDA